MKIAVLGIRGFPNVEGDKNKRCENLYPLIAADKKIEIVVLSRAPYTGDEPYEYKGVKVIPLSCPRNSFLEAIVHTFKGVFAAKRLHADVVHIHAIGPAIMTPLARMLGMKVVMTHHGPDYERKKWGVFARMVLHTGEAWGCRWANKVIAIADNIADDIKRKYNVTAAVIPNGVALPPHPEWS